MRELRRVPSFVIVVATLLGSAAGVVFAAHTAAAAPAHAQPQRPAPAATPAPNPAPAPPQASAARRPAPAPRPPGAHPVRSLASSALCLGSIGGHNIKDFPCPADKVSSWWESDRNGPRARIHAFYLFHGLNALTNDGRPLWRTWPTSTQVFPGQFGAGGTGHHELATLPGGLLEHPAPGTPRLAGADLRPGVDPGKLELPGGPDYQVPSDILKKSSYQRCIRMKKDPEKDREVPFLIDGPSFQNNGDVMIAAVVFSPDVAGKIAEKQYWSAEGLDKLVPPPTALAGIEAPVNSIVLKIMFWPVRGESGQYTPLPVWDNLSPDANTIIVRNGGIANRCEVYAGFENKDLWKRAVALNAGSGALPPTAVASYLGTVLLARRFETDCTAAGYKAYDTTYYNAPTVPLDRFYTVSFTAEQLKGMDDCDHALLDQSAYWSYGRAFAAGDKLAMIAMHIMTKEQPGWTFQSAWWYDGALSCQADDDQCKRYVRARDQISDLPPGPWQNYLMTTTYGVTQQADGANRWPRVLPNDRPFWPVAYNPYIELAVGHPIATNCINCHRRAAWPNRISASRAYPIRKSAYLAPGSKVPGLLEEFPLSDPRLLSGLAGVDSLWTISDRAYYAKGEEPVPAH